MKIVHGEYVGWKGWKFVDGPQPMLSSPSYALVWEGPTARAHTKPTNQNSAGIYALAELDLGAGYFDEVYGRVALSGDVVPGDRGWRAEVATIQELWIQDLAGRYMHMCSCQVTKALAERYQCNVNLGQGLRRGVFALNSNDPYRHHAIEVDGLRAEVAAYSVSFTSRALEFPIFAKATPHIIPGRTEIEITLRGYVVE